MDRYELGESIGEGAFGVVFLGHKKGTKIKRAIKRIKKHSTWEGLRNMRELRSLITLPAHDHIVRLLEVIREHHHVHFVFELMPGGSLKEAIARRHENGRPPLPADDARSILYQVLLGVQHMHTHHIYHRDLKPENILLDGPVAKVADFSMARGIHETDPVTSYVSTRWYRAPEILLASKTYGSPADLFALGCVYAEMHTGVPLFAGFDELDQLRQIFAVVGTPHDQNWRDGIALLQKSYRVISWPPQRTTLDKVVTNHMKGAAIHLLTGLLRLDPDRRLTADQALDHAVFRPLMMEMEESSRKRSATTTAAVAVTPSTITTSHKHPHKKNKPAVVTISPHRADHGLPFPALQQPPPFLQQQQQHNNNHFD